MNPEFLFCMKKAFFVIILASLLNVGCIPHMEKVEDNSVQLVDSSSAKSVLSQTSTGKNSLADIERLKNQGYSISYVTLSGSEIQAINGHKGGGYKINGKLITIYINSSLGVQDQAHVIVHELVHIKDDIEIDQSLQSYAYVSSAAQDFVSNYSVKGIGSFDQRVVSYVLGTLFCTEMRAYSQNQQLSNEGTQTSYFAKGNTQAQFIDQNYIVQFGTSYGSSASSMGSWCSNFSTMSQIQSQLVW